MIGGIAGRLGLAQAGCFRFHAVFILLFAGLPSLSAAWVPIVELKFETVTTTTTPNTTPNTGSSSGSGSPSLSATTPSLSPNASVSGGANALDFGSTDGNFYADFTTTANAGVLNAVKNLKSFTITGWLNSRNSQVNFSGGRIVSWHKKGTNMGGVDLAYRADGSLSLGVDAWNNEGGVSSNPNKIPSDANVSSNNWRFFAVTYDGTQHTDNVKFYFGTNNIPATLDRTATLDSGTTSGTIAPTLTIGNGPSDLRASPFYSNFHGLIDQVRIYGSTSNTSGVLTLDQILSLQNALALTNVPGVLYEQWNNITGNTISALTSNSRYQNNTPSLTKVQTNFEGFEGSGNDYGARVSGWVKAPVTGPYTFQFVSDDAGELRVSTDANPANKRLVASIATYSPTNTSWISSEPIELQANQYYYVEAIMKQGSGGNFVRVGWTLPSGAPEQPIPQSRVVTTPPDAVPFYPSQYPVYEPGTYVRKASMGWQKEENNDHFYIKTDETEALTAKDGMIRIPTWLQFGGNFPNDPDQGDLRFRWDREVQQSVGKLILETQGVHWAWKVDAGSQTANPPKEPYTEFNQRLKLSGPLFQDDDRRYTWTGCANLNYLNGSFFERNGVSYDNAEQKARETALLNGEGLVLSDSVTRNSFLVKDSVKVTPAGIFLYSEDNITEGNMSRTSIDAYGVTAPRITTKVWKVAPDYVFEKGYKLRSLEETEKYVKTKKHLPEIPSAKEFSEKGLDLTEMNMQLLKKVEELTLHMIAMDKELKALKAERGPKAHGQAAAQVERAGKGN